MMPICRRRQRNHPRLYTIRGLTHESNAQRELAFVATGKFASHAVRVSLKADGSYDLCRIMAWIFHASYAGVEAEMLRNGHGVHCIELRAHSEMGTGLGSMFCNRHVLDKHFTAMASRLDVATNQRNGRRLAGPIWSQ